VAANWKVCAENYLECYHCPVAHPGFSRVIDVAADRYRLETGPWRASQFCAPSRNGGSFAGGAVAQGQFHLLFPNTVVNVMPGTPNLSIGPIVPVSPERTSRWLDYFFAADADERWVAEFLELDDQVGQEDRRLVERVQRGVGAGAIGEGVLLAESEQLVVHFDQLLREALAPSPAAAGP
jgi:choline monooxygenase